jgi:large subunit ribosomal protein L18
MTAEVVNAGIEGDKVVACAHSSELAKRYGWLGDTGNISAAYLTGLICGFRALDHGTREVVFDVGLQYPSKGSRIFAALKGAVDAGLQTPFDKAKLPDEKRVTGQHVVEYARSLSSNTEAYQKRFSVQLSRGLKPEELSAHFAQVKEKIVSSLKKSAPEPEKEEEAKEATEEQ